MPVQYSAVSTYTDSTEWVKENDVVYRPLPNELPIGPEVFDSDKWLKVEGYPEASIGTLKEKSSSEIQIGQFVYISGFSSPWEKKKGAVALGIVHTGWYIVPDDDSDVVVK